MTARSPKGPPVPTTTRLDVRLDEASLLGEACERTGLSEFGDGSFREPLAKLLDAIEREARLTSGGRSGQRTRIVGLLSARLQMQAWLARHREIEDERVRVRLIVVGFPRTGTTLLHRILAQDPRSSWLAWWECRHPAPPLDWRAEGAQHKPDPRIAGAEAEVAAMIAANPALAAIHPLDALAPDEDVMLLEHAFQSSAPASSMNVPSYLRWTLAQDGHAAYVDHAHFLRFLQWQKRMRNESVGPFVLKAPHHMVHLDQLLERYPDAVVVQTHRDPLETLPSLASMALELRRLTSDAVHPSECADFALTTARCRLEQTESVRRGTVEQRFVDVWFGDIVTDALAVVEQIYAKIGLDLPASVRYEMKRYVAGHGRDKRPHHGYTLAQFGLDAEAIRQEFASYRETYVLSHQRGG